MDFTLEPRGAHTVVAGSHGAPPAAVLTAAVA